MDLDELEETIRTKDQLLVQKDQMILSLLGQLDKAYSHFNSNHYQGNSTKKDKFAPLSEPRDEQRRHLLSEDKEYSSDSAALAKSSPSLVLDESIFSNSLEPKNDSCMLCLFPMRDSLHGSQPPKTYSLQCGHPFHLLCLYETVQRRECRKVLQQTLIVLKACGECWIDITESDQEAILKKGKVEKRKIFQESKDLASKISKYRR